MVYLLQEHVKNLANYIEVLLVRISFYFESTIFLIFLFTLSLYSCKLYFPQERGNVFVVPYIFVAGDVLWSILSQFCENYSLVMYFLQNLMQVTVRICRICTKQLCCLCTSDATLSLFSELVHHRGRASIAFHTWGSFLTNRANIFHVFLSCTDQYQHIILR